MLASYGCYNDIKILMSDHRLLMFAQVICTYHIAPLSDHVSNSMKPTAYERCVGTVMFNLILHSIGGGGGGGGLKKRRKRGSLFGVPNFWPQ